MTFEIKLKTGFFKTQCYYLTVGHRQILLTPREADNEKFIIDDNELISICIFKKSCQTGEFEIITQSRVYIVNFAIQTNLEEVCQSFVKEFDNKLISRSGAF